MYEHNIGISTSPNSVFVGANFARMIRAGLVAVAVLSGFVNGATAAKVDLLDFLPSTPGAVYTLTGTAYENRGKAHPCTMILKVVSFDDLGKWFSSTLRYDLVAGSRKMTSIEEAEIDERLRPIREENIERGRQQIRAYTEWTAALPRIVEIGRAYPINDRFKVRQHEAVTTGTAQVSVESVPTELGTFECLCVTYDFEWSVPKRKRNLRLVWQHWYARDFGLVRVQATTPSTEPDTLSYDLTLISSSQTAVFKRAVIAGR